MSIINYNNKYLKYKTKYLNLKNNIDGGGERYYFHVKHEDNLVKLYLYKLKYSCLNNICLSVIETKKMNLIMPLTLYNLDQNDIQRKYNNVIIKKLFNKKHNIIL